MKIMVSPFKRSQACTAALSVSNLTAGHHWQTPLPEILGHSWACLCQFLVGHCSILLGPGGHKILFVPSKSLFPQPCVSSGSSSVGLMVTSFKRAYAMPRSATPRAPVAGHCWPYLPRRHPDTVPALSRSVWHAFCALLRCEQLREPGVWQAHFTRWAMHLNYLPSPSLSVSLWARKHCLACVICLLWRADLWLQPSLWMSTIQDLRKTWLAAGSLLTVWWKMPSLGLRL